MQPAPTIHRNDVLSVLDHYSKALRHRIFIQRSYGDKRQSIPILHCGEWRWSSLSISVVFRKCVPAQREETLPLQLHHCLAMDIQRRGTRVVGYHRGWESMTVVPSKPEATRRSLSGRTRLLPSQERLCVSPTNHPILRHDQRKRLQT